MPPPSSETQPTPRGRAGLIAAFGATSPESAIRIVHLSRYLDQVPRERDALIRLLRGATLREIGAAYGVTGERARGMAAKAANLLIGELSASETGVRVLLGLSRRAQNCFTNEHLTTDEEVRIWVQEHGALHLMRLPNMGRKTYLEICNAYGFDPEEPDRSRRARQTPTRPIGFPFVLQNLGTPEPEPF